jgi:hypothetical protein
MTEVALDPAAMAKLANALNFICGADHPATVAVKAAAASGTDADVKKARAAFLKLKQSDRAAALNMIRG